MSDTTNNSVPMMCAESEFSKYNVGDEVYINPFLASASVTEMFSFGSTYDLLDGENFGILGIQRGRITYKASSWNMTRDTYWDTENWPFKVEPISEADFGDDIVIQPKDNLPNVSVVYDAETNGYLCDSADEITQVACQNSAVFPTGSYNKFVKFRLKFKNLVNAQSAIADIPLYGPEGSSAPVKDFRMTLWPKSYPSATTLQNRFQIWYQAAEVAEGLIADLNNNYIDIIVAPATTYFVDWDHGQKMYRTLHGTIAGSRLGGSSLPWKNCFNTRVGDMGVAFNPSEPFRIYWASDSVGNNRNTFDPSRYFYAANGQVVQQFSRAEIDSFGTTNAI